MTQPTFSDGPPVPMMVDGLLDPVTLRQLFADLRTHASVLGIREKHGPKSFSSDNPLTLEETESRLLTGLSNTVQIRYRYDNHEWTDTIMALPDCFRTVRCLHGSQD